MFRTIAFILFLSSFSSCSSAQNGRIISNNAINIKTTPVWNVVANENMLKPEFEHLNQLNFSKITYESDGLEIDGFIIEPKTKGKYPVVIFNRGGNRTFNELTLKMLIFSTAARLLMKVILFWRVTIENKTNMEGRM